MLEAGTLAVVFESGVVSFDQDGVLSIHLSHSAAAPHPLVAHEHEGELSVPPRVAEVDLRGSASTSDWRPRAALPPAETRPEGLVIRFVRWDWAQVEMSGDLTVFIEHFDGLPDWMVPGHVHRFAGPDGRVTMWTGSAPPPSVTRETQRALEDPYADMRHEPAMPPPSGKWVGGPDQVKGYGCGTALALFGLGLLAAGAWSGVG